MNFKKRCNLLLQSGFWCQKKSHLSLFFSLRGFLYLGAPESVLPWAAASALPENLLGMHILKPNFRPSESETDLGWGLEIWVWTSPSADSEAHSNVRTPALSFDPGYPDNSFSTEAQAGIRYFTHILFLNLWNNFVEYFFVT